MAGSLSGKGHFADRVASATSALAGSAHGFRMDEIAAPVLKGFDIVYLQDWGNAGFHLIRGAHYCPRTTCITILHGPSEWELSSNGKYPGLPNDLHLAYQERYSAKHRRFRPPTRYMAEHLKQLGWEFPSEPQVPSAPSMPVPSVMPGVVGNSVRRANLYPGAAPQWAAPGSWHRVSTVPRL